MPWFAKITNIIVVTLRQITRDKKAWRMIHAARSQRVVDVEKNGVVAGLSTAVYDDYFSSSGFDTVRNRRTRASRYVSRVFYGTSGVKKTVDGVSYREGYLTATVGVSLPGRHDDNLTRVVRQEASGHAGRIALVHVLVAGSDRYGLGGEVQSVLGVHCVLPKDMLGDGEILLDSAAAKAHRFCRNEDDGCVHGAALVELLHHFRSGATDNECQWKERANTKAYDPDVPADTLPFRGTLAWKQRHGQSASAAKDDEDSDAELQALTELVDRVDITSPPPPSGPSPTPGISTPSGNAYDPEWTGPYLTTEQSCPQEPPQTQYW